MAISSGVDVDEPIKMYLREIGQVPLLTHKQEIEHAKNSAEGDDMGNSTVGRSQSETSCKYS